MNQFDDELDGAGVPSSAMACHALICPQVMKCGDGTLVVLDLYLLKASGKRTQQGLFDDCQGEFTLRLAIIKPTASRKSRLDVYIVLPSSQTDDEIARQLALPAMALPEDLLRNRPYVEVVPKNCFQGVRTHLPPEALRAATNWMHHRVTSPTQERPPALGRARVIAINASQSIKRARVNLTTAALLLCLVPAVAALPGCAPRRQVAAPCDLKEAIDDSGSEKESLDQSKDTVQGAVAEFPASATVTVYRAGHIVETVFEGANPGDTEAFAGILDDAFPAPDTHPGTFPRRLYEMVAAAPPSAIPFVLLFLTDGECTDDSPATRRAIRDAAARLARSSCVAVIISGVLPSQRGFLHDVLSPLGDRLHLLAPGQDVRPLLQAASERVQAAR